MTNPDPIPDPHEHGPRHDHPRPAPLCGVLVVDKPEGPTGMEVCARVRAALRRGGQPHGVKVGHGGTLDPLATGVMVVLAGKATRLCDQVMAGEKRYTAVVDLEKTSNTEDREGEIVKGEYTPPTREEVDQVCARFVGNIVQRPPVFSALNVGGKRAYRLARKGRITEMPERPAFVRELRVLRYEWPQLEIDVTCGKGTYIRSIARDIGAALNVGGMLWALRRTGVGRFTIDQAVKFDTMSRSMTQADLMPVDLELEARGSDPSAPANGNA
jgi:tRNA pseudouridine55 synthase